LPTLRGSLLGHSGAIRSSQLLASQRFSTSS